MVKSQVQNFLHPLPPPLRPPIKKSLFPVQRVAEIMASRAATISFLFFHFFGFHENMGENMGERKKRKKKVSSRTFFSHPASLPETELFLWTASRQDKTFCAPLLKSGNFLRHLPFNMAKTSSFHIKTTPKLFVSPLQHG